jgi:hypothetical protein
MNIVSSIRKGCSAVAGAAAGLAVVAGSAHAAVPAEVTTAMGDMKTDALVVGAAFLVALVAIAALKMMRRSM